MRDEAGGESPRRALRAGDGTCERDAPNACLRQGLRQGLNHCLVRRYAGRLISPRLGARFIAHHL